MDTYENAVRQIYHWQHNNTNSFCNGLCSLWQKADDSNKARLAHAYPNLALAMVAWDCAGNGGEDLFIGVSDVLGSLT